MDTPTYSSHQLRVFDEKQGLDEKAHKLAAFLASPRGDVDPAELGRLRVQHAIMDAYAAILAERIANF